MGENLWNGFDRDGLIKQKDSSDKMVAENNSFKSNIMHATHFAGHPLLSQVSQLPHFSHEE